MPLEKMPVGFLVLIVVRPRDIFEAGPDLRRQAVALRDHIDDVGQTLILIVRDPVRLLIVALGSGFPMDRDCVGRPLAGDVGYFELALIDEPRFFVADGYVHHIAALRKLDGEVAVIDRERYLIRFFAGVIRKFALKEAVIEIAGDVHAANRDRKNRGRAKVWFDDRLPLLTCFDV